MSEEELKKKYFEAILSLRGKELLIPFEGIVFGDFVCSSCPLSEESCDGRCAEWDEEFNEQYKMRVKVIGFEKKEVDF